MCTGNPHYFDEGKTGEKLLFNYLGERNFDLKQEGLSRAEYKNRIYYEAGILKMKYRMMRWHMGFTDGNRTAVYMKALKVFLRIESL